MCEIFFSEYEVEDILDYHEKTEKHLVRWKGFPGLDSWEPFSNLKTINLNDKNWTFNLVKKGILNS